MLGLIDISPVNRSNCYQVAGPAGGERSALLGVFSMSCFTMTSLHASLPTARPVRTLSCTPLAVPCYQGFGRVGRLGLAHFEGDCTSDKCNMLHHLALRLPLSCIPGCRQSLLSWPQNGSKWTAMRHGNKKAKLGRPADQRKALLRSLTTELLRHGKIKTTKVCNPCTPHSHMLTGSLSLYSPATVQMERVYSV